MAVSAIRRYTPPTCTLEILAKQSVLSRWTDRAVLQDVRFHLSFDGPQRPQENRVTLRGDRDQLEGLCDVVEQYVQQVVGGQAESVFAALLQPSSSPAQLPGNQTRAGSYPAAASPPAPADLNGHSSSGPQAMLNGQSAIGDTIIPRSPRPADMARRRRLAREKPVSLRPFGLGPSLLGSQLPNGVGLHPAGNLGHRLAFGSLATGESGASIQLSTVELFDLANALEEYRREAIALPSTEQIGWLGKTPPWMRVAAVAVFAVGTTTAIATILYTQNTGLVSSSADQEEVLSQVESLPTTDGLEDQEAATESAPLAAVPADPAAPAADAGPETAPDVADTPSNAPDSPPANSTVPAVPTDGPLPSPPSPSAPVTVRPQPTPGSQAVPGMPSAAPTPTEPEAIPPELAALPPVEPPAGTAAAPEAATSRQRSTRPEALRDGTGQTMNEAAPPSRVVSLPQVNEVRAYFQERWQPPADLDRTLEYRLTIGTDGSLQRIVPLGQSARLYLGQAGFPSPSAEFVSPLAGDRLPTIRLALGADGQVRTFLETMTLPPETPE